MKFFTLDKLWQEISQELIWLKGCKMECNSVKSFLNLFKL